ncbi:MAG TPA: DUF4129 domain-containing protein [Gemmatimonadaceae bacterium]
MLLQQAASTADIGLDAAAVRDTIAAVFNHPGYDQSLRQSIGDRLLEWGFRVVSSILDALLGSADIRWLVIGSAAVIVAVVLARAAFVAAATARGSMFRAGGQRARAANPWNAAAAAAAREQYTEAAHLLYAAVLDSLAAHHRIVLHPSRTAGEYRRELRFRAPGALPAFTAFVRVYERAIWTTRECSREDYARLFDLATRAASPGIGALAA